MRTSSDKVNAFLASGLGLGLSPVVPGTTGTLTAVVIHVLVVLFTPASMHLWLLGGFCLAACVGNNLLTEWAQDFWDTKDPRHFVLDEVAGYLLIPLLYRGGELWQVALWGFLGFRFLDIVKPPPAWQFNKRTDKWGILCDDLVAGLYTALCLYAGAWVSHRFGWEAWLLH